MDTYSAIRRKENMLLKRPTYDEGNGQDTRWSRTASWRSASYAWSLEAEVRLTTITKKLCHDSFLARDYCWSFSKRRVSRNRWLSFSINDINIFRDVRKSSTMMWSRKVLFPNITILKILGNRLFFKPSCDIDDPDTFVGVLVMSSSRKGHLWMGIPYLK